MDPADLRLDSQGLGDAECLKLVSGLAIGQDPGDKAGVVTQHLINEPVEFIRFVAT
jgi:hypothetical protein